MRAQREIRRLNRTRPLALACSTLLILTACQKSEEPSPRQGATELAWARAALERNPNLEVVATDSQAGVFTVRDKNSGEVLAVKLSELAAAPVAQLGARAPAPVAATPAELAPAAAPQAASEPASASSEQGAQDSEVASASATAESPAPPIDPMNYTIERSDSGVKVSGPGISIVSSGRQGTTSAKGEAGQRAVDPIICEGRRMVHLDNRRIFVEGDAITARDGCELHITNSRIVASGTGVVVQDATVHISNSYIEGATGSFDAGIGAKMFMRDTTFNGVMHRDAFAQIQEQGGNQFR